MSAVEPNGADERRDPANRSKSVNPASESMDNAARASETAATVQASKYDVIVDLLDAVLSMTPDERARFLDGLAARHEDRARELRELLEALPDPEYPTDTITPVEQASGSAAGDASNKSHDDLHDPYVGEPLVGEIVGGCRLTSVLGRGGIGTVFAAEQVEPPRPVAVKVLRAASARASHVRRFQTEAAALARLEHPAIVRIYASGIARREGLELPYIVMERVTDATNFVDWARASQRTPREIAACLAEVCDGMQHGHRRGLIHRDLKPTNILVASDGTPRIIDFGVARIFGEEAPRAHETLAGALIGTPAYMAPEQFELASAEIDTRVDIHALGTILYEALVGRRAYGIPRHLYFDAARIIRATEPVPVDRIDRNIPRDLAAIVAKSISKDRDKRYATMAEFADDLRAFLDGRAVRARPESRGERAGRWIRRNPAWAMAVAVIAIALVASTVFTTISWKRASHQLMLASLERAAISSRELHEKELAARLDEVRDASRGQVPEFIYGILTAPFDGAVRNYAGSNQGHRMAGRLSPDRRRWIASGDGGVVHIVDLVTHAVVEARIPDDPAFSWACGFTADGTRAFVGCEKGIYEVLSDGRCEPRFKVPIGQVRGFEPTTRGPAGLYFFVGSQAIARFVPEGPEEPEMLVLPGGTGIGNFVCVGDRMFAAAADANFYAMSVGEDGTIRKDPAFQPPRGRGIAIAATADGALFARGLHDGRVQILNPHTGALYDEEFVRHDVNSLAFTPSGKYLYAGDRGGRVHRYRVDETTASPALEPVSIQRTQSTDPVWAIGAINETEIVANVSFGIYRLDFGPRWAAEPQQFPGGFIVSASRFDGQRIRALGSDGRAYELDLVTGIWSQTPHGELGLAGAQSGKITADGTALIAWDNNQLVLRDLVDGSGATIDAPNALGRPLFAWSPDGTLVACVFADRVVLLDRAGNQIDKQEFETGIMRIAEWFVDPTMKQDRLVVCAISGVYQLREFAIDAQSIRALATHETALSVLWCGDRFVQPELSGPIRIFERGGLHAAFLPPQTILKGHFDVAKAIDFSPDRRWLVSGGEDGTVRVWNIALSECFLPLSGPGGKILFVQWSPDGRSILAADQFGRMRFFDSVSRHERLAK